MPINDHVFLRQIYTDDTCSFSGCEGRSADHVAVEPKGFEAIKPHLDSEDVEPTRKFFAGIGPDAPLVTNEQGGVQSHVPYRFDLMDPKAIYALAEVLDYGIKRGYVVNNWRYIDTDAHLNHVLAHILAWLGGDAQDKHLEHAFTRMMFALAIHLQGGPWTRDH